jgi:hypothetical protein
MLHRLQQDLQGLETGMDALLPKNILTHDPTVPMSQFDMAVTQFCFLGVIVVQPERFGIWNSAGLRGFIHLWAVLGHLIGIEERFNLGLHYGRQSFREVWDQIFLRELKETDGTAVVMWEALVNGLEHYVVPFLRLKPMTAFLVHDVGGVNRREYCESWSSMNVWEKACYFVMVSAIWGLRFELVRVLLNFYLRLCIWYGRVRYIRK